VAGFSVLCSRSAIDGFYVAPGNHLPNRSALSFHGDALTWHCGLFPGGYPQVKGLPGPL